MSASSSRIPFSSLVIFVFVLGLIVASIFLTHGSAVPLGLRWLVTAAWIAATVILGFRDLVFGDGHDVDTTAIDRWTAIHAGAGIVLGLWYVPLLVVLVVTIGWEVFEALVPGFGDKEIILNRVTDVVSAVVLWLGTVAVVMLLFRVPFPLFHG